MVSESFTIKLSPTREGWIGNRLASNLELAPMTMGARERFILR